MLLLLLIIPRNIIFTRIMSDEFWIPTCEKIISIILFFETNRAKEKKNYNNNNRHHHTTYNNWTNFQDTNASVWRKYIYDTVYDKRLLKIHEKKKGNQGVIILELIFQPTTESQNNAIDIHNIDEISNFNIPAQHLRRSCTLRVHHTAQM